MECLLRSVYLQKNNIISNVWRTVIWLVVYVTKRTEANFEVNFNLQIEWTLMVLELFLLFKSVKYNWLNITLTDSCLCRLVAFIKGSLSFLQTVSVFVLVAQTIS